jgi:hypothetical protein
MLVNVLSGWTKHQLASRLQPHPPVVSAAESAAVVSSHTHTATYTPDGMLPGDCLLLQLTLDCCLLTPACTSAELLCKQLLQTIVPQCTGAVNCVVTARANLLLGCRLSTKCAIAAETKIQRHKLVSRALQRLTNPFTNGRAGPCAPHNGPCAPTTIVSRAPVNAFN